MVSGKSQSDLVGEAFVAAFVAGEHWAALGDDRVDCFWWTEVAVLVEEDNVVSVVVSKVLSK